MKSRMKRCFVALALPDATAAALLRAQADLAQALAPGMPVCWVPRANLHLTLKFLGNVADAQLIPLTAALRQLAATLALLRVQAAGLGVFGGAHPRAIYADIDVGKAEVVDLMARIDMAFPDGAGGAAQHQARVPHVTLARVGSGAFGWDLGGIVARLPTVAYGALEGHHMVLYQSVPGADGSRYTPMSRLPLGKSSA